MGLYLDILGAAIVLFTGIFAVILKDNMTPGLAGLALSFSFQMISNFQKAGQLFQTAFERLLNHFSSNGCRS